MYELENEINEIKENLLKAKSVTKPVSPKAIRKVQATFDPYSEEIMDRLKDTTRGCYIYKGDSREDVSLGEVFVISTGNATEIIYINMKGRLTRLVMQGSGFDLRTIVGKFDFIENESDK